MEPSAYHPPVSQFLTYGACDHHKWPQYVEELKLSSEHIPELIRMATDAELNWVDSESLEVWAPTHAWRSLAQLKVVEVIKPLLGTVDETKVNDWLHDDIPTCVAQLARRPFLYGSLFWLTSLIM